MTVYLNPGHDRQRDAGAVHPALGLRECDLAWDLGLRVRDQLARSGVTAVLGQDDDLAAVCRSANTLGADLFVSLHFNAFNGRASGSETLVFGTPAGFLLGHAIQSHLAAALKLPNRGLKERPDLYVLRHTAMPAALVETCFIDNDGDIRRYLSRTGETARAIARGICQYPARSAA